jgi:hypothetical protein
MRYGSAVIPRRPRSPPTGPGSSGRTRPTRRTGPRPGSPERRRERAPRRPPIRTRPPRRRRWPRRRAGRAVGIRQVRASEHSEDHLAVFDQRQRDRVLIAAQEALRAVDRVERPVAVGRPGRRAHRDPVEHGAARHASPRCVATRPTTASSTSDASGLAGRRSPPRRSSRSHRASRSAPRTPPPARRSRRS